MKLNIALKINDSDIEKLISFTDGITAKYNPVFKINDTDRIPHLTLFQGNFNDSEIDALNDSIKRLASNYSPFKLYGLRLLSEHLTPTSIWYQFANRIKLIALHFETLSLVSEFDISLEDKFKKGSEFLDKLNPIQKEQIERFKNPYLGYVYDPHITLCRLENNEDVQNIVNEFTPDLWEIRIEGISIFEGGEHGTCKNVINEFTFT
ncbi:MAG: hypothetical protein Q9M91_04080 [Candidatus Dojkabacteria bacterium]|nr:hypothetical protein [Candidatus Dojkabacteria bacterium]MDQ7020992.1 hypothetical protein [Candidatus Dojkabacteria bacterium]